MIQIVPSMRILVAVTAVDFRKGIDGLAGICRTVLQEDPFSGCLFVFRNKRGRSLKFLLYDGQGFWLCQKRLSKGRFKWWPKEGPLHLLAAHELQTLVWNGNPGLVPALWKPLK
ncbi:MAG: IS66 family insertion sequence element accessory protein TnpB [Methanomicrobium sp.]|nr:IS66 family insertion sequence element accessory protein TnpB [Methanomicrobium sp.]